VKVKSHKFVPLLLCAIVIGTILLLHALGRRVDRFDVFQRLEWMTFDWRVRQAATVPAQNATNLGFVFISNESIEDIGSGSLGFSAGLYWPRFVYGRVIDELHRQGAETVAFDVLFPELRRDHLVMPDGTPGRPDENFARSIAAAGNVILAAEEDAMPHELFRTNAWALGHIAAKRESDGILRRARACEDYLLWHPLIRRAASHLDGFHFDTNRVILRGGDGKAVTLPIERDGSFDQAALYRLVSAAEGHPLAFPSGVKPIARAFTRQRVWDLGIMVAARHLGLDLDSARFYPDRIVITGTRGIERIIPVDRDRRFSIDWNIPLNDPKLAREAFHSVLRQDLARRLGQTNDLRELWRDKLVFVGSVASGNDLTDFGATPLDKGTFLTSRYWNVANSLLTGRFVHQLSLSLELLLILALGGAAGLVAWRFRAFGAALVTLALAAVYFWIASHAYLQSRLWLPIVMPCAALFLTQVTLITCRAVFEQSERRRIKSVFDKIVSPNVVDELLQAERLSLGGARRHVSVFFADVRGFTELTDESQARAATQVASQNLEGSAAEACLDGHAADLLRTINLYLGAIADVVKKHNGTLDKYIGDCVMAFWGAPTPNARHALGCVQAAIDAQRAIHDLNQQRAAHNKFLEEQNHARAANGEPPLPLLKLLAVGIGLNTGIVTVGLMGSEQHTFNYTILGRDVNLAQRLEAHSGRARIFIGESTYQELLRDDPALAATCQPIAPAQFKGFRDVVKLYEVPWKMPLSILATTPAPTATAA
jgi:class 3 adenylate cyclase/CHASE2 domain-containing sensor protein